MPGGPSRVAKYGSTVAVASMGNSMLAQYYGGDTRVGGPAGETTENGLRARLADGRAGTPDDYDDALFIRRTLFNSN